jgi:hypothetical protein
VQESFMRKIILGKYNLPLVTKVRYCATRQQQKILPGAEKLLAFNVVIKVLSAPDKQR